MGWDGGGGCVGGAGDKDQEGREREVQGTKEIVRDFERLFC